MTQAVLTKKLCKALVRNGVTVEPCQLPLKGENCSNRREHMYPMVTGFCDSGWHEGNKIDKPTCKEYMYCPCKCHQDIWFMFSLGDMERLLQNNSIWTPGGQFVMPSREERIRETILSSRGDRDAPILVQSPAPGIVPDAIVHTYDPTPTGRAARGELETWVREVTDIFAVEEILEHCTPQYISDMITRRHGLGKPPSTGAVDAVLKRWEKINFAVLERKPTRFLAYTAAGIQFGLDFMKAQARMG